MSSIVTQNSPTEIQVEAPDKPPVAVIDSTSKLSRLLPPVEVVWPIVLTDELFEKVRERKFSILSTLDAKMIGVHDSVFVFCETSDAEVYVLPHWKKLKLTPGFADSLAESVVELIESGYRKFTILTKARKQKNWILNAEFETALRNKMTGSATEYEITCESLPRMRR